MNDTRPNILLIMPDQMRGDCLSLAGHPVLLTPNIDEIGGRGVHFTRAYSTCTSCIGARRSLLTGQFPGTHGMVGYCEGVPLKASTPTLPQVLVQGGYRTCLVGRHMHQSPYAESYGYQDNVLASTYIEHDEYFRELEAAAPGSGGVRGHGISCNGWTARPWQLPDHLHPTSWIAERTRRWLRAYTDAAPFFLTASFYAPHPPLIPPAFYFERYLRQEMPPPVIGAWAVPPAHGGVGQGVDCSRVLLRGEALRSAQAGYFGLINHLDDQLFPLIGDFKSCCGKSGRPWIIVFTSDHGEMLGDHYLFRKCEPYEGSARIPFLVQGSQELGLSAGAECREVVALEDIMPTLLELAALPVPASVEGCSLLPVLRGKSAPVRQVLHSEHATCYSRDQAYHMLTDGRWKYLWRSFTGHEQLFDLHADPQERTDLAGQVPFAATLASFRQRLTGELRNRPEGFSDGVHLIAGRAHDAVLPSC